MTGPDFIREQVVTADALRAEGQMTQAAELLRALLDRALEEIDDLIDQRNALEEVVWHHKVDAH